MHGSRLAGGGLVAASLALAGCPSSDGGSDGTTHFAIAPLPAYVNASPVTATGTKAAAHGVYLDGALAVAVDAADIWSLPLTLDRGDQLYRFELQEGSSTQPLGEPVTVELTLDTTPPQLSTRSPSPNAVAVVLDATVTAAFTEPLDCTSVTASSFALFAGSTPVVAVVACENQTYGCILTLTPGAALESLTLYTATLFPDIIDRAGNALSAAVSWQFETVDLSPPSAPTYDAPPPPSGSTINAHILVGGDKEAFASVEFQRSLGGTLQQAWSEIVGKTGDSTWSSTFDLGIGANLIELRSIDASSNVSDVSSFTVTRDSYTVTVDPPTLSPVTTPTRVRYQILSGTKPVNTSVWNGGTMLVPFDAGSTWAALAALTPGSNPFGVTARDAADNTSVPAAGQTIVFDDSWGAVSGGSLTVSFTLKDLWELIGDEFNVTPSGNDIDHFGVDIWVEGPYGFTGASAPYTYEPCLFDDTTKQRRHTRYAASIVRSAIGTCISSRGDDHCYGMWGYEDYRDPNFMAALIESGLWASAVFPIPRNVDRRSDSGRMWASGASPTCDSHLWFFNGINACQPRLMQPPAIDGVTEATMDAAFSNATGQAPANSLGGPYALGSWTGSRTFTWNLKDKNGQFVDKGPYLISVVITADRSKIKVMEGDQETCWDRADHDVTGARRAEGIVMLDGVTASSTTWPEKGLAATVRACQQPAAPNQVTCSCGPSTTFPCPETPNSSTASPVTFLAGGVSVVYTP